MFFHWISIFFFSLEIWLENQWEIYILSFMKKMFFFLISILIGVSVILFFTMPTFYLFSPIEWTILSGGKPLANTKIVRTSISGWFDGQNKYSEETVTDENWKFSFPVRKAKFWGSMLFSWFPHETVITQEIILNQWDIKHHIWWAIKRNYNLYGELKDPYKNSQEWPIRISCSLEDEMGWDDKVNYATKALSKVQ